VPADRPAARRDAWLVFATLALGVTLGRWTIGADPLLAHGAPLSPLLFGLSGLLAATLLLLPSAAARGAALLASGLLGMAVAHARLAEAPADHLSRLTAHAGPADPATLVRVRGTVLDRPARRDPTPGTLDEHLTRFRPATPAFTLDADTLVSADATAEVSGTLRVFASGLGDDALTPGDRVEVLGLLRPVRPAMNPGAPDAGAWARQSGRAGTLSASADTIRSLAPASLGGRVRARTLAALHRFRAGAASLIDGGAPGAGVARAMLLGDRGPDGRDDALYARTGVSHLLAISGFHLGVLAALTVGVVRLTGDYPRTEAVVGLAVISAYALLVPARTPILRAALLAGSLLVAHFFSRRYDRLTILAWVSTLLVVLRPMDLTTLGFQLTVGVSALLLWLSGSRHPWVHGRDAGLDPALLGERGWGREALARARSLVVVSAIVWAVSAPAILWHTGSFNPLTPLAVVAATPVAVLVQVLGMAGLLASPASAPVGAALIDASLLAGCAVEGVSGAFAALGGHTAWPPVSAAWALGATGAGLFVLARAKLTDFRPWLAVAASCVWFGVETHAAGRVGGAARVDMLSVDDGSCLLVRAGGDAALWDAGSLRPGVGVRTIPRALRSLGAPRVRTALVTHANIDHYAALPDAARAIGLERVLVSAPALESMRAADAGSAEGVFLRAMAGLGVSVEPAAAGDELALGGATLRVLWPPAEPPASIRAANDRSLVARLEVPTSGGERRVLLVGDIQRAAMVMLMDAAARAPGGRPALDAEITELAHHGSHHAVAQDFLLAVAPEVVLQSTGPSRAFDRRWNGVKRSLGAAWGITARDGALWAEIDADGSVSAGSRLDR
jgi:competence protein ComEC